MTIESGDNMKSIVRASLLVVVGCALLAVPRAASAQVYYAPAPYYGPPRPVAYRAPSIDRPGVYIGGALFGNFVLNQANAPSGGDMLGQGGGGAVFLGFRFSPNLALEIGGLGAAHGAQNLYNTWTLAGGTADLKVIFPMPNNVRPFLQAGVGYYNLMSDYADQTVSSGGVGFQLGGGLDLWLNHFWTLGARALYRGIYFTDQCFGDGTCVANGTGNNLFLSTLSIEGNLAVHF
jgi:hypothetical protein